MRAMYFIKRRSDQTVRPLQSAVNRFGFFSDRLFAYIVMIEALWGLFISNVSFFKEIFIVSFFIEILNVSFSTLFPTFFT